MRPIFHSIPLKIGLTILITETVLLLLMGTYYINRFWTEIDNSVHEKLDIPQVLMEQRALNFDAVTDFSALEEIIQERVADAFIAKSDGKIFYSNDPSRIGKKYSLFLDKNDPLHEDKLDNSKEYYSTYTSEDGQKYISVQSPYWLKIVYLAPYTSISTLKKSSKKKRVFCICCFLARW